MGRIKFGSDDEADNAPPPAAKDAPAEEEKPETVKFEQKDDDEEVKIGRRTSRRSRKAKDDEPIEVSADLLAEINRPKEEPKKPITTIRKTPERPKVQLT